jgi:transposase
MNEQLFLFNLPEHSEEPNQTITNHNKPRLKTAHRNQIEFISSCIDDLIPEDHPARNIWDFISQMDLSPILNKIQSTESGPGRPAIDPKILLSLWVYAITEGIGSARVINRYCNEHFAFKWLCGGVKVNYHTISDFRKSNSQEFDDLIAIFIARLIDKNLVSLKRVSQDGTKVRASAGSSSFRRKPTLNELLKESKEQVAILRNEIDGDPSSCTNREIAAKTRAKVDRQQRLEQALSEHKKAVIEKGKSKKKTVSHLLKKKKTQ